MKCILHPKNNVRCENHRQRLIIEEHSLPPQLAHTLAIALPPAHKVLLLYDLHARAHKKQPEGECSHQEAVDGEDKKESLAEDEDVECEHDHEGQRSDEAEHLEGEEVGPGLG